MKVVKNKVSGRLVYREDPDFKPGYGIKNAVIIGLGTEEELIEVDATEKDWEKETELRRQEMPPTLREQMEKVKEDVENLKGEMDKVKEDVENLKKSKS